MVRDGREKKGLAAAGFTHLLLMGSLFFLFSFIW